ncbi:hypothetical protein QT972_00325 [Microcoleus sp. herbarium7]|uniref:hypothetical protein n=1 Tax=Microcoleus sp. herbarium7 TaxID=3055435 RepID=UPI002FD75D7E
MKAKQLASELQISDVEVLRLALQTGLQGVSFRTQLLPEQVSLIKKQFAQNSTHQLNPATEQIPESQTVNQLINAEGAIEQVSESVPQETETGIAEMRQTGLSNAMSASESQQAHILETEFQQAADDGLRAGVVKELVRATKQFEGAMLVRDAVFQKSQASRDRLNELLKDSAGDDFLTISRLSSQTYAQTAKVGAATAIDTRQALKNLGVNL